MILYSLVIIALRVMGKRQIGEMQPSELVVAIMISDLASIPMSDLGIPLMYGIIPIFTLVLSEMSLSFLCLKNEKIRSVVSGRPSVIMLKGKIDEIEMKKLRFNLSDLTEELRIQGYMDISQIDTVILETNGQMTVIPKAKFKLPDCSDLNINVKQESLPYIIISDGKLNETNMKKSNFTIGKILKEIRKYGDYDISDVFYMTYFEEEFFVQIKEKRNKGKSKK